MSSEFCVVLTTVATRDEANKLARQLVEQQLAACVQMMPINSVYPWEGAIQQDDEVLLLIKTASARYAGVEAFLLAHHSYSVPEIIQLPIEQGSARTCNGWARRVGSEPPRA
jgi:periplasmic divalent cation tolerance protein